MSVSQNQQPQITEMPIHTRLFSQDLFIWQIFVVICSALYETMYMEESYGCWITDDACNYYKLRNHMT